VVVVDIEVVVVEVEVVVVIVVDVVVVTVVVVIVVDVVVVISGAPEMVKVQKSICQSPCISSTRALTVYVPSFNGGFEVELIMKWICDLVISH
jgi:hypothetical protein